MGGLCYFRLPPYDVFVTVTGKYFSVVNGQTNKLVVTIDNIPNEIKLPLTPDSAINKTCPQSFTYPLADKSVSKVHLIELRINNCR